MQEAYGLDLAQPTMCSQVEADTIHGMGMYKEAPTMLRYGTFVEIMVPLFSMDFFKRDVTNSLSTASSGVPGLYQHDTLLNTPLLHGRDTVLSAVLCLQALCQGSALTFCHDTQEQTASCCVQLDADSCPSACYSCCMLLRKHQLAFNNRPQ